MHRNYDNIESFIKDMLQSVSVLSYPLLCKMIQQQFGRNVSIAFINVILRRMQMHGNVLLSQDGFVMTRGAYVTITDDRWFDKLDNNSEQRVPSGLDYDKSRDGKDVIDCMWLLASMMPNVSEFVTDSQVWDLQFIVPPSEDMEARIFQVAKFRRGYEKAKSVLINDIGNIDDIVYRKQVRRIALFENEELAFLVPKKHGFNIVAVIDENQPLHYRIIEKRKNEDAW